MINILVHKSWVPPRLALGFRPQQWEQLENPHPPSHFWLQACRGPGLTGPSPAPGPAPAPQPQHPGRRPKQGRRKPGNVGTHRLHCASFPLL